MRFGLKIIIDIAYKMWYNLTQNKASIFYNIDSGGLLKMGTPGIGDPYWYEWYVGLKNVIDMLNPDSRIEKVSLLTL